MLQALLLECWHFLSQLRKTLASEIVVEVHIHILEVGNDFKLDLDLVEGCEVQEKSVASVWFVWSASDETLVMMGATYPGTHGKSLSLSAHLPLRMMDH